MTRISIGDMAQGYMLRSQNSRLKEQMQALVEEMSSGRTADVSRHLSGSYAYLSDVERKLAILDGYATATGEARVLTGAMQDALEVFQTFARDLGAAALTSVSTHLPGAPDTVSTRAAGDLERMVAAMNTNSGGRALFSGTATDRPALAPAEDMLADLRIALAGQTTIAGVQTVMDSWFDDPAAGFETIGYTGGSATLAPLAVAEGETLELPIKADNPIFRTQMKYVAMAALAGDPALNFDGTLQRAMMQQAGEQLAFNQDDMTSLRADLGQAEERVEDTMARISSEKVGYQMAQSDLLSVDPYETAARLEDVQYQLEALYAVTVRLSRLSLVEFLR